MEYVKPFGVLQLYRESGRIYRSNFKKALLHLLLPTIFLLSSTTSLYFLDETNFRYSILFSFLSFILYLTSILLFPLSFLSFLHSLSQNLPFKQSILISLRKLPRFLLLAFVLISTLLGSLILGFIPFILALSWFTLSLFPLIEGYGILDSLLLSKYLVKGRFWRTLLNLSAIILPILAIGMGIPLLVFLKIDKIYLSVHLAISTFAILQWFLSPFLIIYLSLLYENLKQTREIPEKPLTIKWEILFAIPSLLGFILMGFLIAFSLLNIFWGRDIPPIDDKELILSKVEIPKSDNAIYDLMFATTKMFMPWRESPIFLPKGYEKIYNLPPPEKQQRARREWEERQRWEELYDAMLRGEKLDTKEAREFIERNEEFFKIVEKALKKDYIQIPTVQDPKEINLGTMFVEFSALREIARFCIIKARFLFLLGKEEEAFEWLLTAADIGKKLIESPRPGGLLSYYVGRALTELSYEAMRDLIPKSHLASAKLSIFADRLLSQHSDIESDSYKRGIKMDYIALINTLHPFLNLHPHYWSKKKWNAFREDIRGMIEIPLYLHPYFHLFFKPKKTKNEIVASYKKSIEHIGKFYRETGLPLAKSEEENAFFEQSPSLYEVLSELMFKDNILGRLLIAILSLSFEQHISRFALECERSFNASATACLFALKAYKEEKGHLPDSLSELVPKYLPKVPIDPFDGKPLRYSKEKGIIYCVGKDLKDSGGSQKFRQTPFGTERLTIAQMDDPTIEIGFR